MKAFLKGLALLAVVTSVVWIAVLWRWQTTRHDASAQDLLTYLIVLPLVAFGLILALRWAVRGALAKEAATVAAQATAPAAASTAVSDTATANGVQGGAGATAWPVLGAWVASAAGGDAAEMLEAAKAGKPRPAPDKTLRNQQGLPVTCARLSTLDTAQVRRAWERWEQGARQTGVPAVVGHGAGAGQVDSDVALAEAAPDHVWRALAALDDLLPDALIKADEWASNRRAATGQAVQIRMVPSWPVGWTNAETAGANHWLQRQLGNLLPEQDGDAASGGVLPWTVQSMPPQSGPQAWLLVDQLLTTMEQQRRDDVVVMLACHSDLGDVPVRALEARQRLYDTDTQPAGCMPGEGAAVLALGRPGLVHVSPDTQSTSTDSSAMLTGEVLAWIHRPHGMRRETSIEGPGKVSSEVIRRLTRQAIDSARLAAPDIGGLCCDSDQHSCRSTELLGTTIDLLPELDVVEDVRPLGVTTGHAAQTGALWAVAGAIEQARATQRPALALSLADEHWRMAAIVRPAAQPTVPGPV